MEKIMKHFYWGPPEENEDDIPAWMLADTYRQGNKLKSHKGTLEDAVREAMRKPAIDVSNVTWHEFTPKDD
jgi:hypothetical protein